ncbi:MAG: TraR/DksA family transcriptional regulator [Vicinamibacterales bacterium]
MSNLTDIRADLEGRLATLLRRVDRISGDLRRTADRDWQERAIELENDDVLEGLDDASRAEAAAIRAALQRLDAGTYGRCARCGREIAPARLAALPSATTCVACAGAAR